MTTPVHNVALVPPGLGAIGSAGGTRDAAQARTPPAAAFADVLKQQAGQPTTSVNFSNHALARLQRRGIEVDAPTAQRLDAGVSRAAAKGSRDAVVLVDGTAFVVAVRNRTVVTAVDSAHMRDHVFTNIDSAVIA
jgi:flagellar operon protein